MLLYVMQYVMLAYLMLFAALSNAVCLYNAFFLLSFLQMLLVSCFVLVYRHIACLFLVWFSIMRSAFNLLVSPNFMFIPFFIWKGHVLSGEIALKNNHYYYYYYNIPLTFQLDMKRLLFLQTSCTLWGVPTNQPLHILFKNNKRHHSFTYPSYLYHFLHHNSSTTNSTYFSRPPRWISSSFNPHHPSTLPSPSHLLPTTHINHPLSQFFTNISHHSTKTT